MTTEEFDRQIHHILRVKSPKEAFFKLCDLYMIASAEQRKEIRRRYFFERDWEAPNIKALAAHIPGEPDREARIRARLILLSFVEEEDFHDGLVKAVAFMNNFLARSQEDKELSKWGWEREITECGVVYKGWEVDRSFQQIQGILNSHVNRHEIRRHFGRER